MLSTGSTALCVAQRGYHFSGKRVGLSKCVERYEMRTLVGSMVVFMKEPAPGRYVMLDVWDDGTVSWREYEE
jgi:hypothetical protein